MAVKKIKKDFDKEQMYSKIMPTVVASEEAPSGEFRPEEAVPLKPAVTARYVLRNYMEDIVLEKLPHTMNMLKACTCERCKKDVMAQALNELPAAYMTVEQDGVEDAVHKLRAGFEVKVSAALIKAVQQIKANPSHSADA